MRGVIFIVVEDADKLGSLMLHLVDVVRLILVYCQLAPLIRRSHKYGYS